LVWRSAASFRLRISRVEMLEFDGITIELSWRCSARSKRHARMAARPHPLNEIRKLAHLAPPSIQ
jgi:hypothetical protein